MEYPRFVSHKEVGAVKIRAVEKASDGGLLVVLDGDYPFVRLSHEQARNKPVPEAGWYLVQYDNGYVSFSPSKAFEEGYTALAVEPASYTEFVDTGFAGDKDPYGIGEYTDQSAAK